MIWMGMKTKKIRTKTSESCTSTIPTLRDNMHPDNPNPTRRPGGWTVYFQTDMGRWVAHWTEPTRERGLAKLRAYRRESPQVKWALRSQVSYGRNPASYGSNPVDEWRTNPEFPRNTWRRMQVILEPELVERLSQWHTGMDAIYALSSTGAHNLVSLSMIDEALDDLQRLEASGRVRRGEALWHLQGTIGELHTVRVFWQEHSAKEAGMLVGEDPETFYRYDSQNYGLTPEEESVLA